MSPVSTAQFSYTEEQLREATEWFVLIRDEDHPSTETLQTWFRWMEADGNRLAFEAVAQTWHGSPASQVISMPTARELAADDYDGGLPVEEWLASQRKPAGTNASGHRRRREQSSRRRQRIWALAASVAAIALCLYGVSRFIGPPQHPGDEFATRTGEQLEITLADGSHVWLGARSRLLVAFTRQSRGVRLESGEAFFAVKKDPTRPFTVHSVSGDITAVGTAFNVRAVADRVTVAVTEGVVSVAPETQLATAKPAAVRVASGQQLTLDSHQAAQALAVTQSQHPGERARWREGVLVYRDERLGDVAADVARYSDRQIEIVGDSVADLRFSGVVYKSAIDEWAAALPESFPVKLVVDGRHLTIQAR